MREQPEGPSLQGRGQLLRPQTISITCPYTSYFRRPHTTAVGPHLALTLLQVVAAPLGSPPGLAHAGLCTLGPAATPGADISWIPRAICQRPRDDR